MVMMTMMIDRYWCTFVAVALLCCRFSLDGDEEDGDDEDVDVDENVKKVQSVCLLECLHFSCIRACMHVHYLPMSMLLPSKLQ